MRQAILNELLLIEGVKWVAISSSEGFVNEIVGTSSKYVEGEVSLLPSMIEKGEELMQELSIEGVEIVTILGSIGIFLAGVISDTSYLILNLDPQANLGLIRARVRDAIDRIRALDG